MLKKYIQYSAFVIFTAVFVVYSYAAVKTNHKNNYSKWEKISNRMQHRIDSVNQIFIQGYMTYYNTKSFRLGDYKQWLSSGKEQSIPFDTNRVVAFTWFSDGIRWRQDIRRVYPQVGDDFRQDSYNGERYYAYNESGHAGGISGNNRLAGIMLVFSGPSELTTFKNSFAFGEVMLSQLNYKDAFYSQPPKFLKQENIDGVLCEKYVKSATSANGKSQEQVWISTKYALPIKMITRVIHFNKNKPDSGYLDTYHAKDIKDDSGIYMPSYVKIEAYNIFNNKTTWLLSKVMHASKIEINRPQSMSVFQHPVRVTAAIVNEITNPGKFMILGGDTTNAVHQVTLGTPPPLEIPGVKADGAAPEVAAAQEKLEIKP